MINSRKIILNWPFKGNLVLSSTNSIFEKLPKSAVGGRCARVCYPANIYPTLVGDRKGGDFSVKDIFWFTFMSWLKSNVLLILVKYPSKWSFNALKVNWQNAFSLLQCLTASLLERLVVNSYWWNVTSYCFKCNYSFLCWAIVFSLDLEQDHQRQRRQKKRGR